MLTLYVNSSAEGGEAGGWPEEEEEEEGEEERDIPGGSSGEMPGLAVCREGKFMRGTGCFSPLGALMMVVLRLLMTKRLKLALGM